VRFDIQTEAERLCANLNKKRGTRVVVWLDGHLPVFGLDTVSAQYMLKHKSHRVVGVYSPGVTVEQIAEDLAVML
tara:strand:+ start:279 stop:503 length:225 start_codon:yes stop_codon:yes gene_type:complete